MSKKERTKKNKEKFLDALAKSLGIVAHACKAANVGRSTFYYWLGEDEEFRNRVEDIEDTTIDFVESELLKRIREGNVPSTIFFLKCKAKNRGYVERQEVTGKDGEQLPTIQVVEASVKALSTEDDVRDNFNID